MGRIGKNLETPFKNSAIGDTHVIRVKTSGQIDNLDDEIKTIAMNSGLKIGNSHNIGEFIP